MNNVRDSIGWCDYTWNPVYGCLRNCAYCYASKMHYRFWKAYMEGKDVPEQYHVPFDTIQYFSNRLLEPGRKKEHSRIFMGSCTDIAFCELKFFFDIISVCIEIKRHTFMFLSKSFRIYTCLPEMPNNVMTGFTLTKSDNESETALYYLSGLKRPFLSIEPLLGEILPSKYYDKMELVIVGAMSGPNAVVPKKEWIDSVRKNIPSQKIFWKNNIKKCL